MIDALRTFTRHSLLGIVTDGASSLVNGLSFLVNRIALGVLIALSAVLFYLHYNVFAVGFVIGFIWNPQIRELADKVDGLYQVCAQRNIFERGCIYFAVGLAALLTMPTSIVTATLYYSAQWGARLAFISQNHLAKEKAKNLTPIPA